jgi:hypothetical protein
MEGFVLLLFKNYLLKNKTAGKNALLLYPKPLQYALCEKVPTSYNQILEH